VRKKDGRLNVVNRLDSTTNIDDSNGAKFENFNHISGAAVGIRSKKEV
jgi:hypothetical protein